MATYEEALKKSLEYFNGDELAAQVFVGKYALSTTDGDIKELTPDAMHRRLAKEFARIEKKYSNPLTEEQIYAYLKDFKYICPQGSPMAGIGNPYQVMSLSNCFVIQQPFDSYGGILKTDQEEAQLMKRRGGVGFDISTIRPKGISTSNAAKTTDGIGVFMERFSNTCREVGQGGRRGALMLTISVHHPEIRTFINIKRNLEKVTGANISIKLTNEFMEAVKNNKEVQLRWPVEEKNNPKITDSIDAREIWHEIIESAWESAEPGLLFWDNCEKYTPSDAYKSKGFGSTSTNPCFSGDALVAVADGRNAVPIKQLAAEGKDVPVYSVNPETGLVEIKTGRNPRITGHNKKLLRVHLDNGSHIDVTPNHKMLLRDGTQIEAKDLKRGDSLPRFKKSIVKMNHSKSEYYITHCNIKNTNDKRIAEHRLISKFYQKDTWEKKYNVEQANRWAEGGLVVHHKDYNGLNNSPDNLELMTWKEHQKYHAEHDTADSKNGRFKGTSSKEIYNKALSFTKTLGRRFSYKEWLKFAAENKLPKTFSKMHHSVLGKNPNQLAKLCANKLGLEHANTDPRLLRTYNNMIKQGYEAFITRNQVLVQKTCEGCGHNFRVEHNRREVSFCSHPCYLNKHNQNKNIHKKRIAKTLHTYQNKANETKEEQAKIWSQLKFDLNRKPLSKEWEQKCKELGVSCRYRTKYGFKSWNEICEAGENFNHKVTSIEELSGEHTVYNITVDDNHTVGIISNEKDLHNQVDGVYTYNCGEIVLSNYDSCRLLLVNTVSFVKDPFTKKASFDYEKYAEVVQVAQRLMDDIIDLELECVDKILDKIKSDPEPEEVKQIEINLWNKIKKSAIEGRRTGLGVTAVGDTLAALNIKYGSSKSIDTIEELYKHLALNSYRSSVQMAKERGAFPIFDYDLEKDHSFINRIMDLDPELKILWQQYGRRNIANTTTAPAGSVSVLTQTTSGIEPAFLLSYTRRRKINPNDKNARVDFIDKLGDKWQEYTVYHHWFEKWMKVTGKNDPKKSPYYGATSNDINWVNKVKAQAAAQRWICHSISNTTNVPKETTVDTIKDIYMTGWEAGCKGVTVYRDGSRSGVLVSNDTKKQDGFVNNHAPKRPEKLPCDIYHMQVRGEKWNFFVGLYDDKPYEIFAGRSKHIHLPKNRKTGFIKKNGVYNLCTGEGENELIIEDLATVFENPTESAFTRTVSLALRHGAPVQYIVEQIEKGADKENEMFSLAKGLMRVLKTYIKNGTKASVKKCPKCEGTNLAYQEGCLTCKGCGYSKCG